MQRLFMTVGRSPRAAPSRVAAASLAPARPSHAAESMRWKQFGRPSDTDMVQAVGEDYGIYETRTTFTRPVLRDAMIDQAEIESSGVLFDATAPPEESVSPGLARCLATRLGITQQQASIALLASNHNMNAALRLIEKRKWATLPSHSYGLVALEAYDPETFCLVGFAVPEYEMLSDPDLHEAIHELTLSAAEMPADAPMEEHLRRFNTDWTTETGERCKDILDRVPGGLQVKAVCLLPWGEYSAHGLHVFHPVSADFPNIGTAAAACILDLSTGVNDRFRFTIERIPDSISEHVIREHYAFGQQVHLFKQPYLWAPDFSVEDMIRYKESVMQPSAVVKELRYAFCNHHMDDQATFASEHGPAPSDRRFRARPNPYRNLVEVYDMKLKQLDMGKQYKENATPSNVFTSGGNPVVIASAGTEQAGGYGSGNDNFNVEVDIELRQTSLANAASERLWLKYYTDNLF